jgi:hypothetical protein
MRAVGHVPVPVDVVESGVAVTVGEDASERMVRRHDVAVLARTRARRFRAC